MAILREPEPAPEPVTALDRDALLREYEVLNAEDARQAAAMQAKIDKAEATLATAREKFDTAARQVQVLKQERFAAGAAVDHQRAELEQQLVATADPKIDQFVGELDAVREGIRTGVSTVDALLSHDPRHGRARWTVITDGRDTVGLTAAVAAAREKAMALKLQRVQDVRAAIDAIIEELERA